MLKNNSNMLETIVYTIVHSHINEGASTLDTALQTTERSIESFTPFDIGCLPYLSYIFTSH